MEGARRGIQGKTTRGVGFGSNFEPLDALLQAYEARLKPLETLEERWKHYPDPAVETRQLEIFKWLTEAAQVLEPQLELTNFPKST